MSKFLTQACGSLSDLASIHNGRSGRNPETSTGHTGDDHEPSKPRSVPWLRNQRGADLPGLLVLGLLVAMKSLVSLTYLGIRGAMRDAP